MDCHSGHEQACAQMQTGTFKCKDKRQIKCKCKCTTVESNASANAQQLNQMQMHLDQIQMHLDQMQMVFYNYVFVFTSDILLNDVVTTINKNTSIIIMNKYIYDHND